MCLGFSTSCSRSCIFNILFENQTKISRLRSQIMFREKKVYLSIHAQDMGNLILFLFFSLFFLLVYGFKGTSSTADSRAADFRKQQCSPQ